MTSTKDSRPTISIVIVSWNRREDLRLALASVRAQDCASQVETVVVDNGSSDGTVEMLRRGECGPLKLIVCTENLGAARGRNLGIAAASGEMIGFMDSDAELMDADVLSGLLRSLREDKQMAGVAPAIYLDAEKREMWLLGGYLHRGGYLDFNRSVVESENPDTLSTCCSLWRADVLRAVGGFDPAYPFCFEDCDLSIRVRGANWKLGILSAAAARHHFSRDGRVRSYQSFAHHVYIESSIGRHTIQRSGRLGYLREVIYFCGREGRQLRREVYGPINLSLMQKLRLFAWIPLVTFLQYPATRRAAGQDWISNAIRDANVQIEAIGDADTSTNGTL